MNEQVWKIFSKKYATSKLEDVHDQANLFDPNVASVIMSDSNFKRAHWHIVL